MLHNLPVCIFCLSSACLILIGEHDSLSKASLTFPFKASMRNYERLWDHKITKRQIDSDRKAVEESNSNNWISQK